MKKALFLSFLFFVTINCVLAQNGRIVINNHANVKTQSPRLDQIVKGYSVRIFFDNSQDARNGSKLAKSKFEQLYPDVIINDEYTAPYFKVTVGEFLTHEEAIILWGNILHEFPNAFVVNSYLPMSTFTNSQIMGSKVDLVENEMFEDAEEVDVEEKQE